MKEVYLEINDIKYLINYLSVKANCYARVERNSVQELDYLFCLDLIKRLKSYIDD